ncbi:Transcriptional regulator, IclR family [Castellaniella defragrans 65Phen]|jgi:DNA-binding IclR family transcriptional regulator|uniref:Transcriptional regulator, IclR family n=1 Tax=Castellaniella defragrans (strain DSM 12143 / CCUG 39792 / 65Phen) TaxID=1437824 RepID=W8X9P3_CASD6|nr:IclR family transcriptional regulator [Castellaniella defragrans]CDM25175.1 Transcriptional regulator, IclR family [Castellaniella defragrans 65Phen]
MNDVTRYAEKQGIQVIARAAALLRVLEKHSEGMTLTALAQQVGLARSTVQRIVDSLSDESLVFIGTSGGRIRLGPMLLSLAAATRFPVTELIRPILSAVADDTDETVALGVAEADHVVFVDRILARQRVTSIIEVGATLPLHCSASGKAILAALSPAELQAARETLTLEKYTARTMTTWPRLEKELAGIRAQGIAEDNEEHSEGISSLAIAFTVPGGTRCTLAITLPTPRYRDTKETLRDVLLHALRTIEKRLN